MENLSQAYHEKVWMHHARNLSKKLNLAWWIELFNLPLAILAILVAAIILLARYFDQLPANVITINSIVVGFILIGLICWKFSQKKFESSDESMVRIEEKMKLRNALSAAKAGVAAWPEAPVNVNSGIDWHWPRTLFPSIFSCTLIICAFFIPIGSHAEEINNHPSPDSRNKLEQSLAELKDEKIVQEEYIQEMEKKVNELKEESPSEWFSHSSLEAIDNLTQSHESASKEIQQNLKNAERTLQNLQKHGEKMNQKTKENLLDGFGKAVENLDTGAMKPNKELLDQLKQIDPKQLDQLSEEQLNQLRQNMRNMAEKLKQNNEEQGTQKDEEDQGDGKNGNGDDQGTGDGDPSDGDPNGLGNGGLNRGPGHAPEMLGDEAEKLKMSREERLKSKDLSNTLPGDLLETTDGQHEIDETDAKQRSGGSTDNTGTGGERVWKNSLLPEEKKAIKKFFK